MTVPLRMPATVATKKGAGYLAEKAAERTVVLTNHGKPSAVVMSPERFDDLERSLRLAADQMIQGVSQLVSERSEFHTVDEVRERLHARR
ncbi:type II toxin-antitoxin system prevent-host-death family antitoxin [Brachybacterium sp. AOP3-A1-3]|uniref:type II toxin-antitoxin system prevent-host-death family antitoxin n=1 Tax=Brachybacterium sp. AOP3-A1-3 TaxID=3457699 RepID=UPI0040342F59